MIEIGMTYTVEKTVTPDMTAKAVGSGGLEVFGTPYMMGLMECAAMWCVQKELPEGKGTVGVEIASSHLAPTPVGMKVTATAEVRALRRYAELRGKGETPAYHCVLDDLVERDYNDMHRAASPLQRAEDAQLLDTSNLTLQQSVDEVVRLARAAIGE